MSNVNDHVIMLLLYLHDKTILFMRHVKINIRNFGSIKVYTAKIREFALQASSYISVSKIWEGRSQPLKSVHSFAIELNI